MYINNISHLYILYPTYPYSSVTKIEEFKGGGRNTKKKKCHFEGHLNAPIVDDEVKFILENDEFICNRHKDIKQLVRTKFDPIKSFRDVPGCWWDFLEEAIDSDSDVIHEDIKDLNYLVETAIWNTQIHHKSYYGVDMGIKENLEVMREIIRLYRNPLEIKRMQKGSRRI